MLVSSTIPSTLLLVCSRSDYDRIFLFRLFDFGFGFGCSASDDSIIVGL